MRNLEEGSVEKEEKKKKKVKIGTANVSTPIQINEID